MNSRFIFSFENRLIEAKYFIHRRILHTSGCAVALRVRVNVKCARKPQYLPTNVRLILLL